MHNNYYVLLIMQNISIYVYISIYIYMYVCVCVYLCAYVCVRKRKYLCIYDILYFCDIVVLYKFSIIINTASWLQHANKDYYYYYNLRYFSYPFFLSLNTFPRQRLDKYDLLGENSSCNSSSYSC